MSKADGIAQHANCDKEGKVTRQLNDMGGMAGWLRRVAHGTDRDVVAHGGGRNSGRARH